MRSILLKVRVSTVDRPLSRGLDDLLWPSHVLIPSVSFFLSPASGKNGSTAFGGHPDEETMGSLHLGVAEIRQCLFHCLIPGQN